MRAADKKFRDAKFVSLTFGGSKQTGKVIAKLDLPAGQDDWNKAVMTIQLPNGETTSGTLKKYRGDAHGMRVKGGASPSAAFVKEQKKVAKAAKGSPQSPRQSRASPQGSQWMLGRCSRHFKPSVGPHNASRTYRNLAASPLALDTDPG